jgi:predicted DNA-binding transcriptional regulator
MRFMANDRAIGGAIFGGSVVGIIVYGLLLYYWGSLVVEITAFVAVLVLLAILAWIGYTMATTPPPEPITDIPEMAPEKPSAGTAPETKKE